MKPPFVTDVVIRTARNWSHEDATRWARDQGWRAREAALISEDDAKTYFEWLVKLELPKEVKR